MSNSELNKSLSLLRGTGLMLNIVIGAGLLALPGLAFQVAGSHALWGWVVCAIAAVPLMWVLITIGRRFPNAGGIASFAEKSYGPLAYIITSLIFLGAVVLGGPAIALTGGYYLATLIPINPSVAAMILVLVAGVSHLFSTELAGKISTSVASVVLVSLLVLIVIGFLAVDWHTAGDNLIAPADIDIGRAFAPFMMIFFAFTGWEVAAGLSEEFKNPKRDFPYAMGLSFIIASFLYFSMAFVVQTVDIGTNYEAAFVAVTGKVFGTIGEAVIALLAVVIIFANLIGLVWVVSRMIFSLGREGYLPTIRTNKGGVPTLAIFIVLGIFAVSLTAHYFGLIDIATMLAMAGQNLFILCAVACLALFKLSDRIAEKIPALLVCIMVGVLIFLEGVATFYPIAIAIFACLLWCFKKK